MKYFTTEEVSASGYHENKFRHTFVQLLPLVANDRARKVNRPQQVPGGGVSSPVFPVKEDACANRFDECHFHGVPVGGAFDLYSLIMRNEYPPWDG